MTTKSFVVENVPELEDKEDYLTDYFEAVVSKSVNKLELLAAVPDRALVTFNDDGLDIDKTNRVLEDTPLEENHLRIAVAVQQNAVLLDRRQYSHFESYLESKLRAGKSVVQQTFAVPGCELVAVCISSASALESILRQKEIQVQSFIRNFHGCIQLDGHPLSEAIETAGKKARKKLGPPPFPKPQITEGLTLENERSRGNITTSDSASGGNDSTKNRVQNFVKRFDAESASKTVSWSFRGGCSPKKDQLKHSEPLPEKQKEAVEYEEDSDESYSAGEEDGDESEIEERPDENLDDSNDTDGEETEEDDCGENETKGNILNANDGRSAWEKKPETMAFMGSKSHTTSSGISQKREQNKQERASQALEPQKDILDIDEHIWNLIKGKLDQSDFCTLKYDSRRQILKFSSLNPKACLANIEDLKADIIEGTPLEIPETLRDMFSVLQTKDFFKSCADDYFQRFSVQFFIQDNSIFFFGWDDQYIDNTKAEILQRFMYADEIANENGMDVSHLRQEKKYLESEFMVTISWTDNQASTVQIQGIYDDVTFARQALEEAMLKYKVRPDSFEFSEEHALYVERHCKHKLDSVLQNVEVSFRGQKGGKYIIEYAGKLDDINKVSTALHEMTDKIKVEQIDISSDFDSEVGGLLTKAIIQMCPKSALNVAQNMFEIETKCCILNDITEQETATAQKREEKSYKKDSTHSKEKELVSVQISSNLKVNIKASGNIVKEKADVLVCPLHESGLLRKLRISKAFQAKDSSLQEKIGNGNFLPGQVYLCQMTCEDSGLKNNVAFVLLSPWTKDTQENSLHQLIYETLLAADKVGAKTVAFPPLGLGLILKYPAKVIAKQFFSAVKEFQEKTATTNVQLNTVNILACDRELYKYLQSEFLRFTTASRKEMTEKEEIEEEKQEDCSPPLVTIRLIHGEDHEDLASSWKERFKSLIIHDEYNLKSGFTPRNLDKKLKQKLRKLVIVMDKIETDSGELVYRFRGLNEDVLRMKAVIADEVHRDVAKLSHVVSEDSPPRGTQEFINYAASINESAPPYWTHQTTQSLGVDIFREVEVEPETAQAIKSLFLSTYNSKVTGHGYDAQNIPKKSIIKFIDVKRIENIQKFTAYANARKSVFEKKCREKEVCKSITEVSKKGQSSLLEPYLSEPMKENLCHEINECYLLHGTKPDIIDAIKRNGCDPAVSSDKAMFGKGVYAAECATKCDQYTDDPNNRLPPGSIHYAFLLRMLLGDIFVCDDSHATVQTRDCPKLNRPPCKTCLEDKCHCANTFFYDSVMGEGKWIFREFVVYRDYLCYPEYIISYQRM